MRFFFFILFLLLPFALTASPFYDSREAKVRFSSIKIRESGIEIREKEYKIFLLDSLGRSRKIKLNKIYLFSEKSSIVLKVGKKKYRIYDIKILFEENGKYSVIFDIVAKENPFCAYNRGEDNKIEELNLYSSDVGTIPCNKIIVLKN